MESDFLSHVHIKDSTAIAFHNVQLSISANIVYYGNGSFVAGLQLGVRIVHANKPNSHTGLETLA